MREQRLVNRPRSTRGRASLATTMVVPLAMFACGGPEDLAETQQELHGDVSLPGSLFEIDIDANLKLDHTAPPSLDWANVAEDRQPDQTSGQNDDSFGQGAKEDTAVPAVVAGSIPPNKSDLLTFGVYLEETNGGKFLHVYWHRVQEPSGTTNMDFEFNQSETVSGNGVTPVRTSGDFLIQYDLAQGGTNPVLFLSKWIDGTEGATAADCEASNSLPCWSTKSNLSDAGDATGSINLSAIPAEESDGLGAISPRTFGEASVDFLALVNPNECVSFGSAYLKSRSSDSFTAALKDFIRPVDAEISNCGTVRVIKKDDADTLLDGATFKLITDFAPFNGAAPGAEDTGANEDIVGTCVTGATTTGTCEFDAVLQGNYWLIETVPPTGYDPATPPYQHVLLAADETIEKTFVNPRQRGAIRVTKTRKHAASGPGDHAHAGVTFTVNGVSKVTDANGQVCFDDLLFATYTVTETVPTGYQGEAPKDVVVDNKASCTDTPFVGETVSFSNTPLTNITVSVDSQVDGGTASTIQCVPGMASAVSTNAVGDGSVTVSDLAPGTYVCTIVVDP